MPSNMELRRLVKEWLKSGDDNIPDELKGVLDDIANRTVVRHGRFVERYERASLKLHLHFGVAQDGEHSDFCAIVHRTGSLRMVEQLEGHDRMPGGVSKGGLGVCTSQSDEAQSAVFINVVEMVENPVGVPFGRAIRSVVRLQPLDECCRLLGNPAHNPRRSPFILFVLPENRFVLEDGEIRSRRGSAVVEKDELPSEVIQAGPEVVEAVPHEDAKAQGGRLPDVKAVDVARAFSIALIDDLVRIAVHVGLVLPVERVEVFLCPDDFKSDPVERMGHV